MKSTAAIFYFSNYDISAALKNETFYVLIFNWPNQTWKHLTNFVVCFWYIFYYSFKNAYEM